MRQLSFGSLFHETNVRPSPCRGNQNLSFKNRVFHTEGFIFVSRVDNQKRSRPRTSPPHDRFFRAAARQTSRVLQSASMVGEINMAAADISTRSLLTHKTSEKNEFNMKLERNRLLFYTVHFYSL